MLVWMDLEMTGLDPARNVIVEIATLVTDDDLNIVAEGPDLVVHTTEDELAKMDDVVVAMHTRSGLLTEIRNSTVTLEEAGAATLAFIKEHVPNPRTVPLCGNSIGMDRRFLAIYLPEIEEHLHYRCVDVSTIKELARRWYPGSLDGLSKKSSAHRAMDDIKESVAELAYWRDTVFLATQAAAAPATAPAIARGATADGSAAIAPTATGDGTPAPPAAADPTVENTPL